MSDASLIEQGLSLMLYGMGVVFVFLSFLVAATGIMSAFAQRYPVAPVMPSDKKPDPRHVAAITAALHQHRNK